MTKLLSILLAFGGASVLASRADDPPPPVELVVKGYRDGLPVLAVLCREPSPGLTIYTLGRAGWQCWTTERDLRAGEVREFGWCPTGELHGFFRIIRHD